MSSPIDPNLPIPEGDINKIDDSQFFKKIDNEIQSASQKRFSKNPDKISADDSMSLEKPVSRSMSRRETKKADLVKYRSEMNSCLKNGRYSSLLKKTDAFIKKYEDSSILPDSIYSLELALLCYLDGNKDISSSQQQEITERLSSYIEDDDLLEYLANSIQYIGDNDGINDYLQIKESLGKMYFKCLNDLDSISKDDRRLALKLISDQPQLASLLTPKNIQHFEIRHHALIFKTLKSDFKEADGWKALFFSTPSMRSEIVTYLESKEEFNLCARCIDYALSKESSSENKGELLFYSLSLLTKDKELSEERKNALYSARNRLLKEDDALMNIKSCLILIRSMDSPIGAEDRIVNKLVDMYINLFFNKDEVNSEEVDFCSELFIRSTEDQLEIANAFIGKGLEEQLIENIDSCPPEDLDKTMPVIKFLIHAPSADGLNEYIQDNCDFTSASILEMIPVIDRLPFDKLVIPFAEKTKVVFIRLITKYLEQKKSLETKDEGYLRAVLRENPETLQIFKKLNWFGDISEKTSKVFHKAEIKVQGQRFEELKQGETTNEEWLIFFNQATSQQDGIITHLLEKGNDEVCFQCVNQSIQEEFTSQNLFYLHVLGNDEKLQVSSEIRQQAKELFNSKLSESEDPLLQLRELNEYRSSSKVKVSIKIFYRELASQYIKIIPYIDSLEEKDFKTIQAIFSNSKSSQIQLARVILEKGFEKDFFDTLGKLEWEKLSDESKNLFHILNALTTNKTFKDFIEKEYDFDHNYVGEIISLKDFYDFAIDELDGSFKRRATGVIENILLARVKDHNLTGDESDLLESMIQNNPSIIQTLFSLNLIDMLETSTREIAYQECLKHEMYTEAKELFIGSKYKQNDWVGEALFLAHEIDPSFQNQRALEYLVCTIEAIYEAQVNDSLDETIKQTLTILIAVLESSSNEVVKEKIKKPITNLKKAYPELEDLYYINEYSGEGFSYIYSNCVDDIDQIYLKHTIKTKKVFPLDSKDKGMYKTQLKVLSNAASSLDLGNLVEKDLIKDLLKMPKQVQLHLFFCSVHHENIDLALKIADVSAKNKPDSYTEHFFVPYQEILTALISDPAIETYDDIILRMAGLENSEAKSAFFKVLAQIKEGLDDFSFPSSIDLKILSLLESNLENLIDKSKLILKKIKEGNDLKDDEKLSMQDLQLIQILEAAGVCERNPESNEYMFDPDSTRSDFPIYDHIFRRHEQKIQALVDTGIYETLFSKYTDSVKPGSVLLQDQNIESKLRLSKIKTRYNLKNKNVFQRMVSVIGTIIKDITGGTYSRSIYTGDIQHSSVISKEGCVSEINDFGSIEQLDLKSIYESKSLAPEWDQLLKLDQLDAKIEKSEVKDKAQKYYEHYIKDFSEIKLLNSDGELEEPFIEFSIKSGISAFFANTIIGKLLSKVGLKKNEWSKEWSNLLKSNKDLSWNEVYEAIDQESMMCSQYSSLQISYALYKTNQRLKKKYNLEEDIVNNPLTKSTTIDRMTPLKLGKKLQPYFKEIGLKDLYGDVISDSAFKELNKSHQYKRPVNMGHG